MADGAVAIWGGVDDGRRTASRKLEILGRILKCVLCKNILVRTRVCKNNHLHCGHCCDKPALCKCVICSEGELYRHRDADSVIAAMFVHGKDENELNTAMCCRICLEPAQERVRCRNGHTTCEVCFMSLVEKVCPICRASVDGSIRDTVMGCLLLAYSPKLRCEHHSLGCGYVASSEDLAVHGEVCHYRPIDCPIEGCKKKSSWFGLAEHLIKDHGVPVVDSESWEYIWELPPLADDSFVSFQIQRAFDRDFLLTFRAHVIQATQRSLKIGYKRYIFVQLIGDEEEIAGYEFMVSVVHPDRVLTHCAKMNPITKSCPELLEQQYGFTLPVSVERAYSRNADNTLNVFVQLCKSGK